MFTSLKNQIARYILVASVALIAAGVPVVQIVQAADCAGSASCGG